MRVACSAFADEPPADAWFGPAEEPGRQVLCVDPSRLAARGALHPYLPGSAARGEPASTARPGALRAQCRVANGVSCLRVERVPGARVPAGDSPLGPRCGLHNADVNLALGDLVEVVRRQAAAHAAR